MRQVLYSLHYPPMATDVLEDLVTECEEEMRRGGASRLDMSPCHRGKRSLSKVDISFFILNYIHLMKDLDMIKGKRQKESPFQQSKRMKAEKTSPQSKKPIVLKKPTPTRKKLTPTVNKMLEDDPGESEEQPVVKKTRNKSGDVRHDA